MDLRTRNKDVLFNFVSSLDLCLRKTQSGKSYSYREIIVFEKLRFQNVFRAHKTDEKLAFSNSTGLKSVFEKLRFRDGLVWTAGLTVEIKLAFSNPSGLKSVFEKLRFRDGLVWTAGLTVEIKLAFSNPSGLKSVFEKLRFRDGLVWTAGLTVEIKLRFQISDVVWTRPKCSPPPPPLSSGP